MSNDDFNLLNFFNFLQYKFNFSYMMKTFLMDGRRYPEIPLEKIILSIISMPLLGITSLLQLDYANREEFFKSLFKSTNRKMVVSDSEITYTLKKMYKQSPDSLGGITDLLGECFFEFPDKNFHIEGIRAAVIDGSTFSRHYATALYVLGKRKEQDYLIDIVKMRKRGKEPVAARKLARRLRKRFGKGYFNLIIYDGLCRYELIQYIRNKTGSEVIVKTKERGLDIIKECELLINNRKRLERFGEGVKRYEGFDMQRKEYYQIWEVNHIKRSNSEEENEYKVVRVREYEIRRLNGVWIKSKKLKEEYWGISTNLELTGEQIRRFCIRRWRIENSGFRQLNMFAKTKREYSKDVEIALPLISLLILAHNLFLYFLSKFKKIGEDKRVRREINNLKYYYMLLTRNTYKVGGRHPPPLAILDCR